MIENSGTVQDKKIHELTEVYDERAVHGRRSTDGKNPQQIIVIDGRGYERVKPGADNIHELTEVVDDTLLSPQFNEAVMKRAAEIIEKIAREIVPDIAERVVREEIEKIKSRNPDRSSRQD
ncbi:MAG: hypothetical protein K4571_07120 [Deltaproteobacteria bacterium]